MLGHVRNWQPPTKDHEPLKRFMISQLECGLEECSPQYLGPPKRVTPEEYKTYLIKGVEQQIDNLESDFKKEVEQTVESTRWVSELRKSLRPEQKAKPVKKTKK